MAIVEDHIADLTQSVKNLTDTVDTKISAIDARVTAAEAQVSGFIDGARGEFPYVNLLADPLSLSRIEPRFQAVVLDRNTSGTYTDLDANYAVTQFFDVRVDQVEEVFAALTPPNNNQHKVYRVTAGPSSGARLDRLIFPSDFDYYSRFSFSGVYVRLSRPVLAAANGYTGGEERITWFPNADSTGANSIGLVPANTWVFVGARNRVSQQTAFGASAQGTLQFHNLQSDIEVEVTRPIYVPHPDAPFGLNPPALGTGDTRFDTRNFVEHANKAMTLRVYIDTNNGDDRNDGASENLPIKTWDRLCELEQGMDYLYIDLRLLEGSDLEVTSRISALERIAIHGHPFGARATLRQGGVGDTDLHARRFHLRHIDVETYKAPANTTITEAVWERRAFFSGNPVELTLIGSTITVHDNQVIHIHNAGSGDQFTRKRLSFYNSTLKVEPSASGVTGAQKNIFTFFGSPATHPLDFFGEIFSIQLNGEFPTLLDFLGRPSANIVTNVDLNLS